MASGRTENPQTWNRYIYVGNNPINITDPTGLDWYYNKEGNNYKWYDDGAEIGAGYTRVVGNNGQAGSFSYEAAGGGYVTLDPYSNNYQTGIASQADAIKLGSRLYDLTPDIRAFAAGFNKDYDRNINIVTAMAVASGIVIAAPVVATAVTGGAAPVTLGLTQTATGVGTTAATVAATNPDKTAQVVQTVTQLSDAVLKNFNRFASKVPANARSSASVETLGNGGYRFTATSAGNVPGSRAVYEKTVDAAGRTVGYIKTTIAPDGRIVHVKDKLK